MSQKYVIVHFIDADAAPKEFHASQWPLHVTLLANFTIAEPLEHLKKALAEYARQVKPFTISVGGEDFFGPKNNVAVSLINPNKNLSGLHTGLHETASKLGVVYDNPAYMGSGFRPHATFQSDSRLEEGQPVIVGDFTLLDINSSEEKSRRRILKTYQLQG